MGKYEVTQAQWQAVMGSNPSYFFGSNRPVEQVSWNTITGSFIPSLNAATGTTFRLPSEAEWEYACRAGTTTRLYWGDDPTYSLIDSYAWFRGSIPSGTHDVGLKLPNAFGLCDMSGNVWEWCQDWIHSTYAGAPSDGSAWESPSSPGRVKRGGCWSDDAHWCRSAGRNNYSPSAGYYDIGFRLAR